MVGLITNEHMKLFRKVSTWVMVIILAAVTILTGIVVKLTFNEVDENWKTNLLAQNESYRQEIANYNYSQAFEDELNRKIMINEYRVEHDIPPEQNGTFWGFMDVSSYLVQLI